MQDRSYWRDRLPEVMATIFSIAVNPAHPKHREYAEWYFELIGLKHEETVDVS